MIGKFYKDHERYLSKSVKNNLQGRQMNRLGFSRMYNKTLFLGILTSLLFFPSKNFSKELPTIHLVRIEYLAEQIVGERLVSEIYRRASIDVKITPLPAERSLLMANTGQVDGETLRIWSFGEKYPNLLRVPTAISSLKTQAFALKKSKVVIKEKKDLSLYRLAFVRGVQHTTNLAAGFKEIHELSDAVGLMRFISAERADVAFTSRINGLAVLKKHSMVGIEPVGDPLGEEKLYTYLYKDFANLIPLVDATIKSMVNSGELRWLKQKYESEYLSNLK